MASVKHSTVRPHATRPLPGPRSAELLARQDRRESNARVYPRRIPTPVDEVWGRLVRDLDGNFFIDFLTVAGVLSAGHNHPELCAMTEQLGRFAHGLDLPTPANDAFTDARLSMLRPRCASELVCTFAGLPGSSPSTRRSSPARPPPDGPMSCPSRAGSTASPTSGWRLPASSRTSRRSATGFLECPSSRTRTARAVLWVSSTRCAGYEASPREAT